MSDVSMAGHARVVGRLRPGDCVRGCLSDGATFDADVVATERGPAGVRVVLVPAGVSPAGTRWRLRVPRTSDGWRATRFETQNAGDWMTHGVVVELRRRCE